MKINLESSSLGRLHLEYQNVIKNLELELLELDDKMENSQTDEEVYKFLEKYDKTYEKIEYYKSQILL